MVTDAILTIAKKVGHQIGAKLLNAVFASLCLAVTAGAFAQVNLTGVFPDDQVQWQITVPANWNGVVVNDLDRVTSASIANVLLPLGYAYTGTARAPDRGTHWDPRRESNDMVRVLDIFESQFGRARRTIQYGCSGGGSTAQSVAEDHPTRFDGVVAVEASSPVALGNMRLDVTFALKALLDTNNQLPLVPHDGETAAAEQAWINVLNAAQQTAQGRARMALAVVLAQYPEWGSNNNPQAPRPNYMDFTGVQAGLVRVAVDAARIAITSRPQWDDPAGFMSWNTGVDYKQFYANANVKHKAIVAFMYEQAGLSVDADLDRINAAPRLAGTNDSVNYWRSRTHTGIPGVPMLQVHDLGDARTPVSGTAGYEMEVRRFGGTARQLLYRQAFIDVPGHCTLSSAEMVAAIETMVRRIDAGAWGNLDSPDAMNALGRASGLGPSRFVLPNILLGYVPPVILNRAFDPTSPGPPTP